MKEKEKRFKEKKIKVKKIRPLIGMRFLSNVLKIN